MGQLEALTSHTWPIDGFSIATLVVRVDDLASRLGLPVLTWEEDGLGAVRGLACRLASDLVFVLEEVQLGVRHSGMKGPNVLVDATDIAARGVGPLLTEIMDALGLSREDLTREAGHATVQEAAGIVAQVRANRHRPK